MKHILVLFMTTAASIVCSAQEPDRTRAENQEVVQQWHARNLERAAEDKMLTALPGVLIDKKNAEVSFYAEITDVGSADPIEFFLIGEESGNAYEALAVALAEPKHIDAAVLALGLPRGLSANPRELRFWPKGERVFMRFNDHHVETLLLDTEIGKPINPDGLVFTASTVVEDVETGTTQPAAQVRPPFSIAANYNEDNTLLDVPHQAPQSAIYSQRTLNPEIKFSDGELIKVVITPEYPDGRRRVLDLRLTVGFTATDQAAVSIADARFSITTGDTLLLDQVPIDKLLAVLSDMVENGRDPFVEIYVREDTPLGLLHQVFRLFRSIETGRGIRVEPPPPGHLYYQAYTPDDALRRRENRFMHPWEIRLHDGILLTRIDEEWIRGEPKPEITTEDFHLNDPQDMASIMQTQNPEVRAAFVYAPPELTHAELMQVLAPIQASHPLIHVYLETPPDQQDKSQHQGQGGKS